MGIPAIYNRKSIRKFKQTEIPIEVVNQIIDAARYAPSGKNKQPWNFFVYGGTAKDRLLMRMEAGIERESAGNALLPKSGYGLPDARNTLRVMREAPILIMIVNPYGKSPFDEITVDERFTEIVDTLSVGAAIEHMLLAAEDMGIGTLWIANTCFAYPELMDEMGTEGQLIGAVALGCAGENPLPRPRKPLEAIVEYRFIS